jgi:hypothetical protein
MNESREGLDYDDMKDELQALRKKLENLENKQAALQVGAHPTARRKFSRRLITASISLAALLVVCGGLLWGQQTQALFIAQNGNASLSNDLSLGGKLMSKGLEIGNSELVFTDADHPQSDAGMQLGHAAIFNDSTTNALIIRGRNSPASPGNRNVLISDNLRVEQNLQVGAREDTGLLKAGNATIYNSLAVGTINVLDPAKGLTVNGNATVTGTIKGKITGTLLRSRMFYVIPQNGNINPASVKMTPADSSVCFITYVGGYLGGSAERVGINRNPVDGYWWLTRSNTRDIEAKAICIGVIPDGDLPTEQERSVVEEGALIKSQEKNEVYKVEGAQRRHVPNPDKLGQLGGWNQVKILPQQTIDAIPLGQPIP